MHGADRELAPCAGAHGHMGTHNPLKYRQQTLVARAINDGRTQCYKALPKSAPKHLLGKHF